MRFLAGFQFEGQPSCILYNLFKSDKAFVRLEGRLDKPHIAYASFYYAMACPQAIACLSGNARIGYDHMQSITITKMCQGLAVIVIRFTHSARALCSGVFLTEPARRDSIRALHPIKTLTDEQEKSET